MPSLDDIRDDLADRNEKVTIQVRTLALGLLAFIAAILGGVLGFGSKDFRATMPRWAEVNLLLIAALLFVVLLVDLVQMVLSLEFIKDTIYEAEYKIERKKIPADAEVLFDYGEWKYIWSWRLFRAKAYMLALSTIWFAFITVIYCVRYLQ